jgi:hypothetical protein
MVDRPRRNRARARDREHRERGDEREHGIESRVPAEPAGECGADHVAGVIRHLVAAELAVEALSARDAERHAGDGRRERRAATAATTCDAATAA